MDFNNYLILSMLFIFFVSLLSGFPVAFVLAGIGVVFAGIGYLSDIYLNTLTGLGFNTLGLVVNRIFKFMDNATLIALPLFIFMGLMLEKSGVAENALKSAQAIFGKIRGGMGITVVVLGVVLAASTGIIGASVVVLGLLSLPVMLDQGYQRSFAVGTIASSGTLGILIPPSLMLIIMADQVSLSVGDLFFGAIFPGILLGALYIFYIIFYSYLNPNQVPNPDEANLNADKIYQFLKNFFPLLGLIIAVLGSIFFGITTTTEASGIGALGAILLAWKHNKLSLKVVETVLDSTFNTTGYIFAIFIGASCFALVLRELGGDELIQNTISNLPFSSYETLFIILLIVFLLGFFLDWMEISIIILPLLTPVISTLGFNIEGHGAINQPELVWFVLLIAIVLQTSFLTPPVGFAIFYLKGVCPKHFRLMDFYKGVIPFVIIQIIGLFIVIKFPQLVLWLPSIIYK